MRPEFAVIGVVHNNALRKEGYIKGLVVDTNQATFRGTKWKYLGAFGRRKFENLLVLKVFEKYPEERVKILYND